MTAARARLVALDLAPVLAFALLTSLASQLFVPVWPVPFTLQTLAVLSSGLLLGARRGAASQATYLAMGALGLPVFAEAKAGPVWLFGPTGGYLWAFILAAALVGWAGERWKDWRLGLTVLGASLALLMLGTLWLSVVLGKSSWSTGFLPFLPGAVVQSVGAWMIWKAARRGKEEE